MTKRIYFVFFFAFYIFACAKADVKSDTTFVYLKNGEVFAFPNTFIVSQLQKDGLYIFTLQDDIIYEYEDENVDHVGNDGPQDIPYMKTFKINNKYNHHVYFDVEGEIDDNRIVTLAIPTIGKYLRPSFTLSGEGVAYVDGQQQISKETKLKFDGDVVYTVANPFHHLWDGSKMIPYGQDYTVRIDWLAYNTQNIPRIDIYTDTGEIPKDKVNYINSYIIIDGMGILPSMEDSVLIRGRGNSSWNSHNPYDKNPFRLKFSHKVKPFGLKKGKNWVLLANKQTGSMTSNAIGMKIAELVETAYPNHIVPVELYINGSYRGNYNFTEKVGLSDNSVDLDDETDATLLELDTRKDKYYFYARPDKFTVNIKSPDFEDETVVTSLTTTYIKNHFNSLCKKLSEETPISEDVDIDFLARFLFVNDIIRNNEINYAKSVFVYREDPSSKYIFGPVWDFDCAYGYIVNKKYFVDRAETTLFKPITTETLTRAQNFMYHARYDSEVNEAYKFIMRKFLTDIPELFDFMDDYLNYVRPSFEHNATKWKDKTDYDQLTLDAKQWLTTRINFIQSEIIGYFDEDFMKGDVNQDKVVNILDVMLVVNHIVGAITFTSPEILRSDYNEDGLVTITDLMSLVNQIVDITE